MKVLSARRWVGCCMFAVAAAGVPGCLGPEAVGSEREAAAGERTLARVLRSSPVEAEAAEGAASLSSLALTWVAAARPVLTTDEQTHLVLELLAQNVSAEPQRIVALDVLEAGRTRRLASFSGTELAVLVPGEEPEPSGLAPAAGTIAPGGPAFVFLDVALERTQRLPRSLIAELQTEAGELIASPAAQVVRERPIRLSPPLRGPDLLGANGCCRGNHGRAVLADESGVFVAQRYAIDFVRLQGLDTFEGDPSNNASYFLFGADVLAARTGRIVQVRDGMTENDPSQPLPPFDVETAAGNYVVQELAEGRFALYAHLQQGSVRVQPGERVRRGQVLGLVGNTGNSTEPHLHFHVMDRPSPLSSNGVPYVFDEFQLQGQLQLSPEPRIALTAGRSQRRNRLPLELDVMTFE